MTIPRGFYREFIIELVFSNQIQIYEYEHTTVQSQGFILYEACFFYSHLFLSLLFCLHESESDSWKSGLLDDCCVIGF